MPGYNLIKFFSNLRNPWLDVSGAGISKLASACFPAGVNHVLNKFNQMTRVVKSKSFRNNVLKSDI